MSYLDEYMWDRARGSAPPRSPDAERHAALKLLLHLGGDVGRARLWVTAARIGPVSLPTNATEAAAELVEASGRDLFSAVAALEAAHEEGTW